MNYNLVALAVKKYWKIAAIIPPVILLILVAQTQLFPTPYTDSQQSTHPAFLGFFEKGSGAPLRNSSDFKTLTEQRALNVPILVHHYVEVVTDERDFIRKSLSIRPDYFERQIKYLLDIGYTFISLDEVSNALSFNRTLPDKAVVLTFDDGYRDFYTDAFPILQKYGVKSINYIVPAFIGKDQNYLDADQIKEMIATGLLEIGAHTMSHSDLPSLSDEDLFREISGSKKYLEDNFGVSVNHFAYPWGISNEKVARVVEEAGYLSGVGIQKGVVSEDSDPYFLPRLHVGNIEPTALKEIMESNLDPH